MGRFVLQEKGKISLMGAHRVFTDKSDICEGCVFIKGQDSEHIRTVLRLQPGDHLLVCDGENGQYDAVIISADKNGINVKLGPYTFLDSEPAVSITLYQSLPKSDKMDSIIQKSVELGVYAIIPFQSVFSVSRISGDDRKKTDRWQKIAREAARQSGRGIVPKVSMPVPFDAVLDAVKGHEIILAAHSDEKELLLAKVLADKKSVKNIGILIGPEGGFSPPEIESLMQQGAVPVSLGKRILRTETAGPAMISALMYAFGEMG
jgi:16S rRNA (uracil1498-N3)-methyltransferase